MKELIAHLRKAEGVGRWTNAMHSAADLLEQQEAEIQSLKAQLAEAEKDIERMNYVCSVTRCDPKMDGNHVFFGIGGRPLKGSNLRDAITKELIRLYGTAAMPKDEAMKEQS